MKKRTLVSLLLSGLLLLSAAGCGPAADPTPSQGGGEEPSAIKIGILIPGSPTDGGFCQMAAEAGKYLEDTYGYDVSVVEAATADKIRTEADTMASEGYRIVFGHGGQYAAPLAEICADYPDTWFVTSGGSEVRENLFPFCLCLEQASYVAGVVAGKVTKSNVIAYTLGGDFPAYSKTSNGFALGARSVNPDIEVLGTVLSAPVAAEAYEATMGQIQMGADVIFSNSNAGQSGALKAVSENDGVYFVGHLGNFNSEAPEHVLLNELGDYSKAFAAAAQGILEGSIEKSDILFVDLSDGAVSIAWNDALMDTFPPEVKEAAEQTIKDIESGKIHVPTEYEVS